jgi:hypothetical protein
VTSSTPAIRPDSADLDRAIAEAENAAVVIWRGEGVPFPFVPERIAELSSRAERDLLYGAYREALEALAPLRRQQLATWTAAPDTEASERALALATDLEGLVDHSETPHYAALRRYLALIGIEQGDATIADLWHIGRGTPWSHWFGEREVRRAVAAAGRAVVETAGLGGWRDAEAMLAGPGVEDRLGAAVVDAAYATLAGSPEWVGEEVGVAAAEIAPLGDFAAFVRLLRLRQDIALLQYEIRLLAGPADAALSRAYYAGIVGHMIGVMVPEEGYLHAVPEPYASVRRLEVALLAAQLVEALERQFGTTWWREPGARELAAAAEAGETSADVLAHLGYDGLDWRPVLRQIRTRLIGEMSGYGGPNITTRAGTRKV